MAFIAMAVTACDPVDENERYSEATEINKDHKVLVEEFTGQFCPNCPLGHEALDGIKKMYGENAVIVSIHAGDMAFEDPDYGLKTPDGDKYASAWDIQNYPSAVVNRTSSIMDDRSQWQGAVFNAARTAPTAKISLETDVEYDEDGKPVKINIKSDLASTSGTIVGKLQLWITEDNIETLQQDGEDYIADYVHNHVYRASVNGIGGEDIQFGTDSKTVEHSIAVASNWNAENLNVVAFVYNGDGVLQTEEVKVKE